MASITARAATTSMQKESSQALLGATNKWGRRWIGRLVVGSAAMLVSVVQAQTPTLTKLYSFNGSDGSNPIAALVQGLDGNFYGTTPVGGINYGTVFKISPSGTLSTLHAFTGGNDGGLPYAALAQGSDGNFYGTTKAGGASNKGTIFKISPTGTLTTLHTFTGGSDGAAPTVGLIQGSDGSLYGTTSSGGINSNGTFYKITTSGSFATLYSFIGGSEGSVSTGLVQARDGDFYGTMHSGGLYGFGTAYKVTISGLLTILHAFSGGSDGSFPVGSFVQGGDGSFYGTTYSGNLGYGTIYKITSLGNLATLHSFTGGSDGGTPQSGLTQASDGNFYGTTLGGGSSGGGYSYCGIAYSISPSGTLTTLVTFNGSDGCQPYAGLVQGNDGTFYGTTEAGGSRGPGTVFKLQVDSQIDPAPPTAIAAIAGNSQVTLTWAASTGAASYNIYQSTASGGEGSTAVVTGVIGTSANITSLINGTTYYFQIAAVNSTGISPLSTEVSATPAAPVSAPSAPAGLSASAGESQVSLSWTASSGATSYSIYQATTPGGEGSTPVKTGITGTSATITGLTNGTTYYFTVVAVNGAGASPPSTEVSAAPAAAAVVPAAPSGLTVTPGDGYAVLSWTAVSSATSYTIYVGATAGGESSTPTLKGITGSSVILGGLNNGATYYFVVVAVNGAGASPASSEVYALPATVSGAPSAPSGLSTKAGDGQVTLSWTAVSGATAYTIYKGTQAGGESGTPVLTGITGTTATITGLTNGTAYYLRLVATNASGTSALSAESSATPVSAAAGGGGGGACGPGLLATLGALSLARRRRTSVRRQEAR